MKLLDIVVTFIVSPSQHSQHQQFVYHTLLNNFFASCFIVASCEERCFHVLVVVYHSMLLLQGLIRAILLFIRCTNNF